MTIKNGIILSWDWRSPTWGQAVRKKNWRCGCKGSGNIILLTSRLETGLLIQKFGLIKSYSERRNKQTKAVDARCFAARLICVLRRSRWTLETKQWFTSNSCFARNVRVFVCIECVLCYLFHTRSSRWQHLSCRLFAFIIYVTSVSAISACPLIRFSFRLTFYICSPALHPQTHSLPLMWTISSLSFCLWPINTPSDAHFDKILTL